MRVLAEGREDNKQRTNLRHQMTPGPGHLHKQGRLLLQSPGHHDAFLRWRPCDAASLHLRKTPGYRTAGDEGRDIMSVSQLLLVLLTLSQHSIHGYKIVGL